MLGSAYLLSSHAQLIYLEFKNNNIRTILPDGTFSKDYSFNVLIELRDCKKGEIKKIS